MKKLSAVSNQRSAPPLSPSLAKEGSIAGRSGWGSG